MKIRLALYLLIVISMNISTNSNATNAEDTIYQFSFTQLNNGEPLPLSTFKGKVILIVNTASNCGFTGQYEDLEELYLKYKEQGLVVIGVPSNDFGKQEPGNSQEIANFCQTNYGVTFPMTEKEKILGEDAHPFYIWARSLGFGTAPKWNFHKYLIDRNGKLVDYFYSTTSPMNNSLVKKIEGLLKSAPPIN